MMQGVASQFKNGAGDYVIWRAKSGLELTAAKICKHIQEKALSITEDVFMGRRIEEYNGPRDYITTGKCY